MSPSHTLLCLFLLDFPRVSGDEPAVEEVPWIAGEFSPRERG